MEFNPKDWFWIVAGSTTQVYSSASGGYVALDNQSYQAFLTAGGLPTKIASVADLGEVLAPYALRPTAPDVLDAYKDAQATKLTIETVAKVLFNHENRLRALEGQSSVSAAQFKNALKALM